MYGLFHTAKRGTRYECFIYINISRELDVLIIDMNFVPRALGF